MMGDLYFLYFAVSGLKKKDSCSDWNVAVEASDASVKDVVDVDCH